MIADTKDTDLTPIAEGDHVIQEQKEIALPNFGPFTHIRIRNTITKKVITHQERRKKRKQQKRSRRKNRK